MGSKGGSSGSGMNFGITNSTSTYSPNPEAMALYRTLLANAQSLAKQPYQPYTGQMVAGFTEDQLRGMQAIRDAYNVPSQYLTPATNLVGQALNYSDPRLFNAQNLEQYQNPYQKQVVDATMANLAQLDAEANQRAKTAAATQGAFGGSGEYRGRAEVARQRALSNAQTLAGLNQSNYQQATTQYNQQQQQAIQSAQNAAYSLGQLGSQMQNMSMQNAQALMGIGGQQQQLAQQQLQNAFNQYQMSQAYPYQTLAYWAALGSGIAPNMGGTTNTSSTTFGQSSSQQQTQGGAGGAAGLLTSGLSLLPMLFSDERHKTNVEPVGNPDPRTGLQAYAYDDIGDLQRSRNTGEPMPPKRVSYMAQDVEQVDPQSVVDLGGLKALAPRRTAADGGLMATDPGLTSVLSNIYDPLTADKAIRSKWVNEGQPIDGQPMHGDNYIIPPSLYQDSESTFPQREDNSVPRAAGGGLGLGAFMKKRPFDDAPNNIIDPSAELYTNPVIPHAKDIAKGITESAANQAEKAAEKAAHQAQSTADSAAKAGLKEGSGLGELGGALKKGLGALSGHHTADAAAAETTPHSDASASDFTPKTPETPDFSTPAPDISGSLPPNEEVPWLKQFGYADGGPVGGFGEAVLGPSSKSVSDIVGIGDLANIGPSKTGYDYMKELSSRKFLEDPGVQLTPKEQGMPDMPSSEYYTKPLPDKASAQPTKTSFLDSIFGRKPADTTPTVEDKPVVAGYFPEISGLMVNPRTGLFNLKYAAPFYQRTFADGGRAELARGGGPTYAGPKYSIAELTQIARMAGATPKEAALLASVAMAESQGYAGAHNPTRRTGDNSYGLWQINMLDKMGPERRARFGLERNEDLYNPVTNARAALDLLRNTKSGIHNWTTYTHGRHVPYYNAAVRAAGAPLESLGELKGMGVIGERGTPYKPGTLPLAFKPKDETPLVPRSTDVIGPAERPMNYATATPTQRAEMTHAAEDRATAERNKLAEASRQPGFSPSKFFSQQARAAEAVPATPSPEPKIGFSYKTEPPYHVPENRRYNLGELIRYGGQKLAVPQTTERPAGPPMPRGQAENRVAGHSWTEGPGYGPGIRERENILTDFGNALGLDFSQALPRVQMGETPDRVTMADAPLTPFGEPEKVDAPLPPSRPSDVVAEDRTGQKYWGDWRDAEPFKSDPIGGFFDALTGDTPQADKSGTLEDYQKNNEMFGGLLPFASGGSVRQGYAYGGEPDDPFSAVAEGLGGLGESIGQGISGFGDAISDGLGSLFGGGQDERPVAQDAAPQDGGLVSPFTGKPMEFGPLSQALLAAGLGMMASRSPNIAGAVGEGGLRGLQVYQVAKDEELKQQKQEEQARLAREQQDEFYRQMSGNRPVSEDQVPPEDTRTIEQGLPAAPAGATPAPSPEPTKKQPATSVLDPETFDIEADPTLRRLSSEYSRINAIPAPKELSSVKNSQLASLKFQIEERRHQLESSVKARKAQIEAEQKTPEAKAMTKQLEAQQEALAKESIGLEQAAQQADQRIATLNRMKEGLESGKFYTGTGGEQVLAAKRAVAPLGLADEEGVAMAEQFEKDALQSVTEATGGKLGAGVSDSDVRFLTRQQAGLGTSKAGNIRTLDAAIKIEQRKKDVAQFAREYMKEHGGVLDAGYHEALSKWAKEHPLFPEGVKKSSASDKTAPSSEPQIGEERTNKFGKKARWSGSGWEPI